MLRYLITLQVPDRKGLVEQIAHAVSRHGGNWLDSELRHIDGIFAAILLLEVPSEHWDDLLDALECIMVWRSPVPGPASSRNISNA